ncbi:MAG: chemotaxis protein CheR [Segetibacter sp.]|nr:chemotaxis protein CheR [Segetibacter sp.]
MKNKFVVAIGSSAGGLDPMLSFFDFTPHDQATYIILRHVPIDHQSQLHTILGRHSKLKIVQAENDTLIEKDTIYMPSASMYMTIKNDRLYLQKRIEQPLFPNWSVDVFFNSLAEAKGNKCIAVILSGTGSDGTKGAISINKAGGMVIAQTPASCVHSAMPLNVIKTGIVDHILNPAEMSPVILQRVNTILKIQMKFNI